MNKENQTGLEIAVIGMWGRFPGAKDLGEFWNNLKNGVESITFFSDEELSESGVDPVLLEDPAYIRTSGSLLEKKDYFDAAFFGYKPVEAEIMDPQTRLFFEVSWQALEEAGYDPGAYPGLIGLYAGSAWNFQWETRVYSSDRTEALGGFAAWLLANRDNLCTLVSYNLGLKGPSVFVKTTCSTSLVAVHLAAQAILNGECDMALAGGVGVGQGEKSGYLYQEGMIQSPDGHCRAFDAQAKGTVGGEGVGIVVLKRYEEALENRDHIHAVIRGTAINNDGSRKIGYTAPSIPGQVDVIREALHVADVEPESITYIETHGTGTPVGDPIEIEALKTAFMTEADVSPDKKQTCWLGSVKTNIGHLDAAAGIAGLMKTILALKHKQIPPSLHFQTPNPDIPFRDSKFSVNNRLIPWENDEYPLRAGVSSFGIGGTNVHIVLEEAPTPDETSRRDGPPYPPSHAVENHLLILSAKTETALQQMTQNLAEYLKDNPEIPLADVAYTLHLGRQAFNHRRMLVCTDREEAIAALSDSESAKTRKVLSAVLKAGERQVVFMFPGLGQQYVNMGRDLYEHEPVIRREIDRCFEILKDLIPINIKEILYPSSVTSLTSVTSVANEKDINRSEIAQIVIFIFEYALAQLLMKWGVKPYAMIGYSFGEYTAACVSGVFTLEEALTLVVARGQLVTRTAEGAMLSVPLARESLEPFLSGTALSLAVDNGPSCIVSGTTEGISAFENQMKAQRLICVRLPHAHRAIHSHLMKPVLPDLAKAFTQISLKEPQIPYISNLSGQWISSGEVTQPGYWLRHLSETVQFAGGIKELLKTPGLIFVEVGPGNDLSVLLRHHVEKPEEVETLHLIDHAGGKVPGSRYLLTQAGRLWLAGATLDWAALHEEERRNRLSLPVYPFDSRQYRLDSPQPGVGTCSMAKPGKPEGKAPLKDWFYIPTWKRSVLPGHIKKETGGKSCWLVFVDETGLGERFAQQMRQDGEEVIIIRYGSKFTKTGPFEYTIDPRQHHDYNTLFEEFSRLDKPLERIAHFWSVTNTAKKIKEIDELQDLGFYSLFYLAQAAGRQSVKEHLHILVISNQLQRVTSEETLSPGKATVLGAVKVIPREYFNIDCRSVDIVLPEPGSVKENRLIRQLSGEFSIKAENKSSKDKVVALRGDYRWEQVFEPMNLEKETAGETQPIPRLKHEGVYLITGGVGGIGLVMAEHLAKGLRAKLVLTGHSPFPPREQWEQWLSQHEGEERTSQRIRKIQNLENSGAEVLVCTAEVKDYDQVQSVIDRAIERFGRIDGVLHAAGIPDGGMIPLRTKETIEPVLAPKLYGTLVLDRVLKEKNIKPGFMVLFSSVTAVLGILGQVAYCAANAFLDAFACYKTSEEDVLTVSIDWDFWQEVGMGAETLRQLKETADITDAHLLLQSGILPSEGVEVFDRIIDNPYPQVIVSTYDMNSRFEYVEYLGGVGTAADRGAPGVKAPAGKLYPRPVLATEYIAPETEFEKTFAGILQTYFGFEQVGIDDNLFEYGITSLDMIHINNMLRKAIAVEIPIVVMFEYPTIHLLGQYLESRRDSLEQGTEGRKSQVENLDEVEDMLHESIDIFDNFGG